MIDAYSQDVKVVEPNNYYTTNNQLVQKQDQKDIPPVYLGFSSSLNNFNGILGLTSTFHIYKAFLVKAGVGLGEWGTKFSVGFDFQNSYPKGWDFGLSYSRCTGMNNYTQTFEETNTVNNVTTTT